MYPDPFFHFDPTNVKDIKEHWTAGLVTINLPCSHCKEKGKITWDCIHRPGKAHIKEGDT